ncbi:MAG TPA: glutathione-disulfide reductase [Stellaceae bacterium]|jgi:glutathione reductase (NADPH)|nr:glutathione-disulfide reductase [Stellaceae bacterium]
MPQYDFDMITIGAGSGGVASSRRAGSYGARVAICEDWRVGGTCVMRGCVPKKFLVYAAEFADDFADAAGYGWTVSAPRFDWPTLIANKNKELDRLEGIYRNLLKNANVALYEGRARIVDPHTVEVLGKRHTAANILVATGARPILPPIPGIQHAITSNEALDLPALPKSIVIVGGAYIACEFAGIFSGLGAEVTMVIRADKILRGFDEDIRDALTEAMTARGIVIHSHTELADIEKAGQGFCLTTTKGERVTADRIMYATGRAPYTANIGLDEAGVALKPNGAVEVDDWSRSSVPSIYAIGDVTDRMNLTPVAIAEGRALAETLFNDNPIQMDHANVPSAVFSIPAVATIGLSEADARRRFGALDIYRTRFKPMKNTLSGRGERTMMKLVVERKTDRVVGCHMVGPDAPELIQGIAIAIKCGATKRQFDQTVGIHPTAGEEFVTMRETVPEPHAEVPVE